MKKILKIFIFVSLVTESIYAAEQKNNNNLDESALHKEVTEPTLSQWYTTCIKLPYYHQTGKNYTNKPIELTTEVIGKSINNFLGTMRAMLEKNDLWTKNSCPIKNFQDPIFLPFTQKLELPLGAEVSFHGDLHGDIHSLVEYLNNLKNKKIVDDNFKIIKDNFYLVFLGDYTDRGNYGIECIFTLLRLKNENPNSVILVRGNHEDDVINFQNGFQEEIYTKFKSNAHSNIAYIRPNYLLGQIKKIYELMPIALYIGSEGGEYIQCNHGGMELGYLPQKLLEHKEKVAFDWLNKLLCQTNFKKIINTENKNAKDYFIEEISLEDREPNNPGNLSFLWGDFNDNKKSFLSERGGGILNFGETLTKEILKLNSTQTKQVIGVFRAHQHSEETMNKDHILNLKEPGVGKLWKKDKQPDELWKNMVATFCVSPDNMYGDLYKFNFDTHGILTIGSNLKNHSRLKVNTIKIMPD